MLLIILTILTGLSVIVLFIGFIEPDWLDDSEDWLGAGIVSLILIVSIGWLFVGYIMSVREEISTIDVIISKSDKSIILESYGSDDIFVFDKKVDFNNITDTTTFYTLKGVNIYNCNTDRLKVFYYDESDIICEGVIK